MREAYEKPSVCMHRSCHLVQC